MTMLIEASARVDRACLWFAKLLMTGMALTVLGQIVARYVFDNPYGWTEELARYFMVWTGLLGATCAFKRGLDPVIIPMPETAGRSRELFSALLNGLALALFLTPILYYSFFSAGWNFERGFMWRSFLRASPGLELNMALVTSIVPLSCAILVLHWFAKFAAVWKVSR